MIRVKTGLAWLGAAVLLIGLGQPALERPVEGDRLKYLLNPDAPIELETVSYYAIDEESRHFDTGKREPAFLICCAAAAALAALLRRFRLLYLTAAATFGCMVFSIYNLHLHGEDMRAMAAESPLGPIILRMIEASGLCGGWRYFIAGIVLMLVAAALPYARAAHVPAAAPGPQCEAMDAEDTSADGESGATQRVIRYEPGVGMIGDDPGDDA